MLMQAIIICVTNGVPNYPTTPGNTWEGFGYICLSQYITQIEYNNLLNYSPWLQSNYIDESYLSRCPIPPYPTPSPTQKPTVAPTNPPSILDGIFKSITIGVYTSSSTFTIQNATQLMNNGTAI